jgi:polysaccharide export outer membrane protein
MNQGRRAGRLACCIVLLAAASLPHAGAQTEEPRGSEPLTLQAFPLSDRATPVAPPGFGESIEDYRIGRQDLLEVQVFGVDELDQIVRVADDGSITMPLLGRLLVGGLTKTEVERMIARLLQERYVHDPQVTVFVKEFESRRVAVSGAVRNPGTYEMLGRKTLLEMLSMAGGLDEDEAGRKIFVFRPTPEGTRRVSVDLEQLVYGADPSLNLAVAPGDIIYLPAVEKIRIFVTGAVKTPDLYEVTMDQPVTVLRAVTMAGGTTDRAAEKRVRIMRTEPNGERVTLEVNLKKIKQGKAEDPLLRADDIVLVPESFF